MAGCFAYHYVLVKVIFLSSMKYRFKEGENSVKSSLTMAMAVRHLYETGVCTVM